jgi:hypothetical protein
MNSQDKKNNAIGYQASIPNYKGGDNVAVGWSALNNCSTASYNNAVGVYALYYMQVRSKSAMGHQLFIINSVS